MSCNLHKRDDDIPKLSDEEKTWECEDCGVLMFGKTKPRCRKEVRAEMDAMHAFADAEADDLGLDKKGA